MSLYGDLLAGQYSGYVLLAQENSQTVFFGWNQQYGEVPQPWRMVPATFDTITGTQPNDWKKTTGYFVSTPTQPQCWTVIGSGPYSLGFRQMLANGLPEGVDIFGLEAADRKAGTVKVSWVQRNAFLANAPDGWVFGEGTAEIFRVGFPGYVQGINSGGGLPSFILWAGE